jgi:hypothetical protein
MCPVPEFEGGVVSSLSREANEVSNLAASTMLTAWSVKVSSELVVVAPGKSAIKPHPGRKKRVLLKKKRKMPDVQKQENSTCGAERKS